MLLEAEIWEHVEKEIATQKGPELLAAYLKKEVRAKRNILDSVMDHLITYIAEKMTRKLMYDALVVYMREAVSLNKCS
jgi:hypothetical protein